MTTSSLIVVGIDGKASGDEALRFAYEEARTGGDALEIVTTWNIDPKFVSPYPVIGDVQILEDLGDEAATYQKAAIDRVLGDAADWAVPVTNRVVRGDCGPILVKAAANARMLVVGSRGYGGFRAALLGSVSRYCARHATCPVVVVPLPVTVEKAHHATEHEALPVGPQALL